MSVSCLAHLIITSPHYVEVGTQRTKRVANPSQKGLSNRINPLAIGGPPAFCLRGGNTLAGGTSLALAATVMAVN